MGFLSGLQGLFDPSRLAVAQAFASGDYQGAAALRARQDELQRQRALRDAQVIGAKNLGIDPAEIDAMDMQDLSRLAQYRALQRMFGSGGGDAPDGKMPMPADSTTAPGQGGTTAGPATGPGPASPDGAADPIQVPVGPFDPSFFGGGDPRAGQLADTYPGRATPFGSSLPPFGGDQGSSPLDRKAAVQQAVAAIRGGADPKAVRTRLNQVGTDNPGFDPSDPFSDLVPGGPQASDAMYPTGAAQSDMLPGGQPLFARDSISGRYDPNRGTAADVGGGGAPGLDRAAAIQHAADAIQRGADPNAVHALLVQMGQGNQAPPNPFAELMSTGGPAMTGGTALQPAEAQPPFDDQGGFARPIVGTSFAQDPLGRLPPRLDPRLAPQKSDALQKSSQQKGSAGPGTLFTYGLPSLPSNDQSGRNPTRANAGAPNRGVGWAAAQTSLPPPPAPWRQGGRMSPAEVEREAQLGMRMYQIHRARGMPPQDAAGWAANAVAESHGQYHQPEYRGGPAYGLFMWQGARRRMFEQLFHHPIEQSTEEEQLVFRDWELSHTLARAARRIPRGSSAGDTAAAITQYYERPDDWEHRMLDRSNIAEAILRRARQMPGTSASNQGPRNSSGPAGN